MVALAAPALGSRPLPTSLSSYLLGPKLIQAELYVQVGAVKHDYLLDRGRLQKRYANGQLTIVKQSGPIAVKVAPSARVLELCGVAERRGRWPAWRHAPDFLA